MHQIFDTIKQAVQFSHIITAFPGDTHHAMGTMVQHALHEAGIDTTGKPDMRKLTVLDGLVADAKRLLMLEGQLERLEACALTATYSRDWAARRSAVHVLVNLHYAPRLARNRMAMDRNFVATLVARHYIAERERGAAWDLASISDQYSASKERTKAAAHEINNIARLLEYQALNDLRRIAGYGPDRIDIERVA
jgi:hypothetical protein